MKIFATKKKKSSPVVYNKGYSYIHHPHGHIQQEQRTRIGHILRSTNTQAKLTIGQTNDKYEQEADRVADRVMALPNSQLQRQAENEKEGEPFQTNPLTEQIMPMVQRQEEPPEEEEETPVQAKPENGELLQPMCPECEDEITQRQPERDEDDEFQTKIKPGETPVMTANLDSKIKSMKGSGQPLPKITRNFFESRIGEDFSNVRIHHGGDATKIAHSIRARAFTLGNNIAFGEGEYAPDSTRGKRLLAHELTHVVQQTGRADNLQGKSTTEDQTKHLQTIARQSISKQPFIQRDLAIRPPRPRAVGRTLSAARVTEAINYNVKYLRNIPNSTAVISMIRDVLGISTTPSVVDADFVRAVLDWQAINRLSQDGKLGPSTARRLFRELGAEKEGQGKVKSGPRYSPQVPTVRPISGGRERTWFRFNAEFESDPAKGIYPSCCEVRQYIRWNAAAAASFAAHRGAGIRVPHGGFPAAHPANRWIEDRDSANTRYGHRTGRFSAPTSRDQYLDSSNQRNQAYGHIYRGVDTPISPATHVGQYRFLVKVIDVCRRGRNIGRMDVIRVNW